MLVLNNKKETQPQTFSAKTYMKSFGKLGLNYVSASATAFLEARLWEVLSTSGI